MLHSGSFDMLKRFVLNLSNFNVLWASRRYDLHVYWRAIGGSTLPRNIGEQYIHSLEEYRKVLTREVAEDFTRFDSRKEGVVKDRLSQMCAKLGEFLRDINHYDSAVMLQQRALDIDHSLFNNMSKRVAESTAALAFTKHKQGLSEEAMNMLYLVNPPPARSSSRRAG